MRILESAGSAKLSAGSYDYERHGKSSSLATLGTRSFKVAEVVVVTPGER